MAGLVPAIHASQLQDPLKSAQNASASLVSRGTDFWRSREAGTSRGGSEDGGKVPPNLGASLDVLADGLDKPGHDQP